MDALDERSNSASLYQCVYCVRFTSGGHECEQFQVHESGEHEFEQSQVRESQNMTFVCSGHQQITVCVCG